MKKIALPQDLAKKLWLKITRHFYLKKEILDKNEKNSLAAIQHDLALVEDEPILPPTPELKAALHDIQPHASETPIELEVEIPLDELQSALSILEQQDEKISSADAGLKELIDALRKVEKNANLFPKNATSTQNQPEIEVIIEFVPLSIIPSTSHYAPSATQSKQIYRDMPEKNTESMSDKIKKEKEQRELSKRITHYPPSDRLH